MSQASLITEYAAVVQPIQLAFQQRIQGLKTQHEEFVASLKQQQPPSAAVPQLSAPAEPEKTPSLSTQAGEKTLKVEEVVDYYYMGCCCFSHALLLPSLKFKPVFTK